MNSFRVDKVVIDGPTGRFLWSVLGSATNRGLKHARDSSRSRESDLRSSIQSPRQWVSHATGLRWRFQLERMLDLDTSRIFFTLCTLFSSWGARDRSDTIARTGECVSATRTEDLRNRNRNAADELAESGKVEAELAEIP